MAVKVDTPLNQTRDESLEKSLATSRMGILIEFSRARLVAAVTLSGALGYVLFRGRQLELSFVFVILGVLFLGCGCSALNQIQEARTDAIMARTRNRPLPAGQLSLGQGWFVTMALLFAGFYFLACIERYTTSILGLGLFSLVWYNGVYTYLKGVTSLAVFPGAVLGAIPPLMGWCAAGGFWHDRTIWMVAFYFFIWQIPHFWLLMLLRGREYEQAGLKSVTEIFSMEQLGRIIFVWLAITALIGFFTAHFTDTAIPWCLAILIASGWLVGRSLFFLKGQWPTTQLRPAFLRCIYYNILFMLFMALDALL